HTPSPSRSMPALAHKLLTADAHGVTCAKLGEAEVMAAAGVRDILIAIRSSENKIARLMGLLATADVIVAVDNSANVRALDSAAVSAGRHPRVVVEMDIGMHRAGLAPGARGRARDRQFSSASIRGRHGLGRS